MAQTHLHVLLKFTSEPDADLQQTTTAVINGLYVDKAEKQHSKSAKPVLRM